MKKYIFKISILISIIFSYCSKKNNIESHGSEDHHSEHKELSNVSLTTDQIKSINIELGLIEKKQLTSSLKANGILKVPNQNKANVTSALGGTIKNILVQTGTYVNKGQTVAIIVNSTFITMQEEFLSTKTKVEFAKIEYERQMTLKEGNASSMKAFQLAQTEYESLLVKKSSLQKQLELIGINTQSLNADNIQSSIPITSPIKGSISSVMINIGSYVDANNPIAEIVDNSQLHLDLYVYEKDLGKLKIGQTIHFTLTNNPGKEYDADVYAISNTFEPNTKAIAIHALVKGDKQGLIDGMSITALVSLENALLDAVPTNSIVSYQGQDFIFIESDKKSEDTLSNNKNDSKLIAEDHGHNHDDHNHDHPHSHEPDSNLLQVETITYEIIPIKKGTTDIGYSEITLLKEIPKGSKIVVNGAFFLLAKMTNQGEAHEH
ncbi:MAG: efflux RND transporter periplasmic adaptor subunit [Saprospiraceae bacterium]|nr:efflux RND transporter periplasmic adaptor subunit [Saprospiraceae bacterium]